MGFNPSFWLDASGSPQVALVVIVEFQFQS